MADVRILLATRDGGAWLPEQLASLEAQTHRDWTLHAADDGSGDDTPRLLADFVGRRRGCGWSVGPGRGAAANFARLLRLAKDTREPYLACCDQDDVWLPDRLAAGLERMAALERRFGASCPLLVHSDLCVTDRRGDTVHRSFLRYQRLRHEPADALGVLLVQNFVTGCTALFNRALLEAATPQPGGAVMHDWWLALVAAAAGRIGYVDRPLVRYRQHGANVCGAVGYWRTLDPLGRWSRRSRRAGDAAFASTVRQARCLRERLPACDARERTDAYLRLVADPPPLRQTQIALRRLGVRRQDRLRNLLLHARLARRPLSVMAAAAPSNASPAGVATGSA